MKHITPASSILVAIAGLYLYALHQIVFLVRFGGLNTRFSVLDLFLIVVGILSILLYIYFARGSSAKRKIALRAAFMLSIPFSFAGTLAGGLLGGLGIFIYGLIPCVVCLSITHLLFKRT